MHDIQMILVENNSKLGVPPFVQISSHNSFIYIYASYYIILYTL